MIYLHTDVKHGDLGVRGRGAGLRETVVLWQHQAAHTLRRNLQYF